MTEQRNESSAKERLEREWGDRYEQDAKDEASAAKDSAAQGRLTLKENVVMRLIGLVIFVAPGAGVRFLASVTEGVIEKIGESRV